MPDPEETARLVSDRHFGIGSDGLILICPSKVADFEMRMYNADGSRGEMCGNGIRCVGKYVYDYGLTDKTDITVETLAGIKYLEIFPRDRKGDRRSRWIWERPVVSCNRQSDRGEMGRSTASRKSPWGILMQCCI